jgi:transposase-like protein
MGRRSRRTFTPAFKAQVILEFPSEQRSSAELCRELPPQSSFLATWKDMALSGLPPSSRREEQRGPEQSHIAELEQLVSCQMLELEIVNKASRRLPGTAGI